MHNNIIMLLNAPFLYLFLAASNLCTHRQKNDDAMLKIFKDRF